MKILLLFTFLCSGLIFAQDKPNTTSKPEYKTKIELFESRTGAVLIKSFVEVYEIGRWLEALNKYSVSPAGTVEAWELVDAKNGAKALGVKVKLDRFVFIDLEEIDAVLKGIDYVLNYEPGKTRFEDWEIVFESKDGLKIIAANYSRGIFYAAKTGGKTHRFHKKSDLKEFKSGLEKAKTLLTEDK
jgi:hypothetical protein